MTLDRVPVRPPEGDVPASQSRTTLARVMGVMDCNNYGNVHGGVIMRAVDEAAAVAAVRHSDGPAVTVFMDSMEFREPVKQGDLLTTYAQVNWTGTTSMEVGVHVTAQRLDVKGEIHVATAYLVFVAIDADGRPRPIPQLIPETDEDRRRREEARIRRESRLRRREAIRALRESPGDEPSSASPEEEAGSPR